MALVLSANWGKASTQCNVGAGMCSVALTQHLATKIYFLYQRKNALVLTVSHTLFSRESRSFMLGLEPHEDDELKFFC